MNKKKLPEHGSGSTAKKCFELFVTFFKIGLFTFGGGYAMLSVFENEFVEKKKWLTGAEMMDMIAVAESTPGPIAVNTATYVGFRRAGVAGAVCGTLGVVLPSFLIIFTISLFLGDFMKIELVRKAFYGIRAAVAVLIIDASFKLRKSVVFDAYAVAAVVAVLLLQLLGAFVGFSVSSIILILVGAAAGVALYRLAGLGGEKK